MARYFSTIAIVLALASPAAAEKVLKETMVSGGATRTYYLLVPDSAQGKPAPLIILLHGSGRDGRLLVDHWASLAKQQGIILVGPDAIVRAGWSMRDDGPPFLRDLVDALKTKVTFDPKRVYLFGHSAGAIHGLAMAVLESEYFAAVVAHAGVLGPEFVPFVARAPRKTPIGLWVGTSDPQFPLDAVRRTRDALNQQGFNAELTEVTRHTHDYYSRSGEINKGAWAFLQDKHLDKDPRFQDYVLTR